MLRYRLSDAAQADVIDILAWTQAQFGEAVRLRYESLIVAALRDVATQPDRAGSIERSRLGAGVRSWHLRLSRDRVATGAGVVRRPRHFLIYRFDPALLVVGRVLHDAIDTLQREEASPERARKRLARPSIKLAVDAPLHRLTPLAVKRLDAEHLQRSEVSKARALHR